ncbi:MAG: sulfate/molybdate ABC transporter ATP-binding protein [Candidatus Acidiferrales bacterium]
MTLEVQISKRLPDFTLEVAFSAENAPLAILGPSGAGKSMLLRCIAGLERPERGRIVIGERVLLDTQTRVNVATRNRRVGLLFQHYALFPHRTVAENIAFAMLDMPPDRRAQRVQTLLRRAHADELGHRYPRQLSGGEQQRAALARSLAIDPDVLLLDEPLSALDTHLRSQTESQLQELFAAYQRPTLLVTHNIEEAYRLSGKLLVLSRGRVAAYGDKEEVFRRPPTLEVARLTACKNFSRARLISTGLVEALDWGCQIRVAHALAQAPAHVGIRAHHIDFVESSAVAGDRDNTFPCWLVRSSETPFRITLYLRLHQPPRDGSREYHLQAEVFKEKWERFRDQPLPWHVRLSPESLIPLPD